MRPDHRAPVFRGKRRQLSRKFLGTGLDPLLQPRRKRAVPLQVFLRPRRQVSSALGQARRQIRTVIRIVARDDFAIALAKKVFAAFLVVGVLVFVVPLSLAVALAVALRVRGASSWVA